jgi:F-type H+-transporting ATPase subunit b
MPEAPAPAAHTEAPAEHNSFPPFQSSNFPSQLLWLALTFILLYVLMARIALPRIGRIFAERSRRIEEDLAAAQRLKEQSEAAGAAYQKSLAEARSRAQSIASDMREKQAAEAAAVSKKLEAQLQTRLAAAEKSISAVRAAAMQNVSGIAAETAAAIVERLIGKPPAEHDLSIAVAEASKS